MLHNNFVLLAKCLKELLSRRCAARSIPVSADRLAYVVKLGHTALGLLMKQREVESISRFDGAAPLTYFRREQLRTELRAV